MKYTTTLVLAAIVLALAVLIYVYRDPLTGPAKPPERPSETLALLKDVKMDDLVSATLEEPAGEGKFKTKMAFKKAEGKWRMTEPVDGAADDYEVGRLLRAAVEGQYRQSVEPGAKGQPTFASLGLEPPAFRLVLVTAAKGKEPARTITVGVGRRSALGEGLYVRVDDQPKAAILEKADLLERARDKANTYRGRDLVALAREDVVRINLSGEKGKAQIDRSDKDKDRWVMAQPMVARVDPEAASSLVRAAMAGATAKEFIEDDPKDLARYGLDKPRLTVTLWKQGPARQGDAVASPPPEKPGTGNREGWFRFPAVDRGKAPARQGGHPAIRRLGRHQERNRVPPDRRRQARGLGRGVELQGPRQGPDGPQGQARPGARPVEGHEGDRQVAGQTCRRRRRF
jgi:hypothetical protein